MTIQDTPGTSFWRQMVHASVASYLPPLFFSGTSPLVLGDDRLLGASYSVIAPASLLAALAVVLGAHTPLGAEVLVQARGSWRRAFIAALPATGIATLCTAIGAALGADGWQLFLDAVPSAAIGAGITAATITK